MRSSMFLSHKQGFTLVELSIVLVIIGLLAGGILAGRDLIHAAEIQKQIRQVQEYQLAFNTFLLKYKCIPGDCPNATEYFGNNDPGGHPIYDGDGNGLIDTELAKPFDPDDDNRWSQSYEMNGVFQQLSLASFISFRPERPSGIRVGRDLPVVVLNNKASFFISASYNFIGLSAEGVQGATPDELTSHKKGNNAMYMLACDVGNHDEIGYWNDSCATFLAHDMYLIDLKVDDGKALSGNLLGFGGDDYFGGGNLDCLVNEQYKPINTTTECQAVVVLN